MAFVEILRGRLTAVALQIALTMREPDCAVKAAVADGSIDASVASTVTGGCEI